MQTKRDYLVGLGLAKPGRGKFSNAAKEALAKAEAEGVKFADVVTKVPTKKATGNATENAATGESDRKTDPKPDARETPYLTPDEYRFPEGVYKGVTFRDGKKVEVSLRECCNTCRVSLVNHMCESPTILGGTVVKIVRR